MNEHNEVINFIKETFTTSPTYNVLVNFGVEKKWHIGGIFPDVIVTLKENNSIVFIIEVETNGNLVSSIQQWKNYINLPGTFYIVVPENKLNEVKSLAVVSGVKAKFGFYRYVNNKVTEVVYEP